MDVGHRLRKCEGKPAPFLIGAGESASWRLLGRRSFDPEKGSSEFAAIADKIPPRPARGPLHWITTNLIIT